LIFGEYPRMGRNGFRWAPRSLLGARTSSIGTIADQLKGRLKTIGSNEGLAVKYPGTKCKLGPAAELLSARDKNMQAFLIAEEGAQTDVHYSVELGPSSCKWDPDVVYGLVFATKPSAGEKSLAMIGSQVPFSSDDEGERERGKGTHFLRYECNAVIHTRSEPAPQGTFLLPFYKEKTPWMIM